MLDFPEIIEALEAKMAALKEQAAKEVTEAFNYLIRIRAKTKLRPRLTQTKGYNTFSIVWRKVSYFNKSTPRATRAKVIRKGRRYLLPKANLFKHCQNCDSWEWEYIWEKEQGFARVREQVDRLSQAIQALRNYPEEDRI